MNLASQAFLNFMINLNRLKVRIKFCPFCHKQRIYGFFFTEKADTLNGLERHLYAEKVVMAFCDVLGVDKDDVIEEYKNSTE